MKKTLLGIFAAVATAVLIFVIEQWLTKPVDTPVLVNGQVLDKGAKRLLENVSVRVHVASVDESQPSDSLGRYAFSLDGFKPTATGSISAQAPGYNPVTYNLSLQDMSALHEIYLEEVAPPVAGGPSPAHPTVILRAMPAAQYVKRLDAVRLSAVAH